jgi:hypothetical protein
MKKNNFKIRSRFFKAGVAALAFAGATQFVQASVIPYDPVNLATPNPDNYYFTTTSTEVTLYDAPSSAGDTDMLSVSINGGTPISTGLNNRMAVGSPFSFAVTPGEKLTFSIFNTFTVSTLYSSSSLNSDGYNHAYAQNYVGGSISSFGTIPSGTYVGFEDLKQGQQTDFDYNDLTFVATNLKLTVVPETTTLVGGALLSGMGMLVMLRNRKMKLG